jgi:hypothetical protein
MRSIHIMYKPIVLAAAFTAATVASASADVVISTDPTSNMSCVGGVCAPTKTRAVLNVTDLENLLASGNVRVVTTNGGVQANNIDITAAFSWSAANSLTLDAYQSITFSVVVQNLSTGNVSLVTNDGGGGGALTFAIGRGRFDTDAVSINGKNYTMAKTVKQLAFDVVANPGGYFAFSRDADASKDGLYYNPPIPVAFLGSFNGLGHTISNLEIADASDSNVGLFAMVKSHGSVASVTLQNAVVQGRYVVGILAAENNGTIANASAGGTVKGRYAGGLVGGNSGTMTTSQSSASVSARGNASNGGGLLGSNSGTVSLSFATGKVSGGTIGGLIGGGGGTMENSYATGRVSGQKKFEKVGGFMGGNFLSGWVDACYSIGPVNGTIGKNTEIGGFDGYQEGTASNSYWDTDTSGQKQGSGDGNETGLTGLTTQQFQSGLPAGFNPAIWAEDTSINNGFPYLINNPPAK